MAWRQAPSAVLADSVAPEEGTEAARSSEMQFHWNQRSWIATILSRSGLAFLEQL